MNRPLLTDMNADTTSSAPVRVGEETIVIPLVEEVLTVGKRIVETGRTQLRKTVEERQETIALPHVYHEAEIIHVPINQIVEGEAPAIRQEGDTLIVPLLEEVTVLVTRLMLREEVHIISRRRDETTTETVSLRREAVTVLDPAADK